MEGVCLAVMAALIGAFSGTLKARRSGAPVNKRVLPLKHNTAQPVITGPALHLRAILSL